VPSEPILVDAIHNAAAAGVLLVAAAGNLHSPVMWPAADLQPSGGGRSFGLAVGATDFDGRLADFSSSGQRLSLVAPGNYGGRCSGVLVALPQGNAFQDDTSFCVPQWSGAGGATYGYIAGTSFSAPEVAGVAALIWAARPGLKNYQVADIIKQAARRDATGWTPTMGCGLLDAGAALELATGRSAAAWAEPHRAEASPCSTSGDELPGWPDDANQTITFDPIGDKKVRDPDFRINATASSGLPVSFAASGSCTINGTTVHITGAGTCTIVASQPGDATYNPARNVWQTFSIGMPAVVALPARGSWGASLKLPFRVGEAGAAAVTIRVQKNRSTVARLALRFSGAEPGQVHAVAWPAPSVRTKGTFRFCVTLTDQARNTSTPSCARIRLR
jgi:hypothetical protein